MIGKVEDRIHKGSKVKQIPRKTLTKRFFLIPKKSPIYEIIIREAHSIQENLYGGPQSTLFELRQSI